MPAYTTSLGLLLPSTGEFPGQWGTYVNDYLTQYLDSSVAGTQTISGNQTAVTLTVTNGATLTQAGAAVTGSAQFQIINCTGNPASLLTIIAPASSRQYIVLNSTSTNQSVKIVGAGPTTGVTLVAGEKAHVAWNGSDFVKVASTVALPAGSTTQVQYNNAGALAGSANLTFDGTTLTTNGLTLGGAGVVTPATNVVNSVGYTGVPQNSQSAPYTLVAADAGKSIVHPITDNNARTFTIPANSSVPFPVGTAVTFINMINTVTISITSDTMYLAGTGTTGSRTLAAYGVATAVKVGTTSWIISGNGLT